MPRYLTQEWLDAAQEALDSTASLPNSNDGVQLTVQQIVTDGPDGDVAFHIVIDDGRVRVVPGDAPDPTVTFMQDWNTATAISRGEISAQGAFMSGRIRVRGDLPRLVECGDALSGVDDVLAGLRADTEY